MYIPVAIIVVQRFDIVGARDHHATLRIDGCKPRNTGGHTADEKAAGAHPLEARFGVHVAGGQQLDAAHHQDASDQKSPPLTPTGPHS